MLSSHEYNSFSKFVFQQQHPAGGQTLCRVTWPPCTASVRHIQRSEVRGQASINRLSLSLSFSLCPIFVIYLSSIIIELLMIRDKVLFIPAVISLSRHDLDLQCCIESVSVRCAQYIQLYSPAAADWEENIMEKSNKLKNGMCSVPLVCFFSLFLFDIFCVP